MKFAADQQRMANYSILAERALDRDNDIESIGITELDSRDTHEKSPTAQDEWHSDPGCSEQQLRRVCWLAWIEAGLLILLVGYVFFLQFSSYWTRAVNVPLGVDPSGFVPPGKQ